MNYLKINMTGSFSTFTYNAYYVPRVGESVNFSFAGILGTVASVTWNHANEVTLAIKTR